MIKEGQKYKHFKGNIYQILCVGKNSETLQDVVVYKNTDSGDIWVRDYEMFISKVDK